MDLRVRIYRTRAQPLKRPGFFWVCATFQVVVFPGNQKESRSHSQGVANPEETLTSTHMSSVFVHTSVLSNLASVPGNLSSVLGNLLPLPGKLPSAQSSFASRYSQSRATPNASGQGCVDPSKFDKQQGG